MIYSNPDEMRQETRRWRTAFWQIILLVLFMALAFLPSGKSQVIERQIINAFGGSVASPTVEHSAGEAVTLTRSGGTLMATQGFHQTYVRNYVGLQDFVVDRFGVSLYPNPSSSVVNIAYSQASKGGALQLALYSSSGQLVRLEANILTGPSEIYELNISALSEGIYHLNLSNGSFQSNHKIIKTN